MANDKEADFNRRLPLNIFDCSLFFDNTKMLEIVKTYLSKEGTSVNDINILGNTFLHEACQFDNLDTVKFLVERGADVNAQNINGSTPITLCIRNIYPNDMIIFLLETCNIDIHIKNNYNFSFYEVALQGEMEWILKLIDKNIVIVKPSKKD